MTRAPLLLALTLIALPLSAALSPQHVAWREGPARFIMSPDEIESWNAVTTDAQAEAFITSFWARRDPTPATPANEAREEFERRVGYADANFRTDKQRGAMTDRGRIWILFGRPTRMQSYSGDGPASQPNRSPDGYTGDDSARESWTYDGPYAMQVFTMPRVEFRFVDYTKRREFELEPTRVDVEAARQRLIAASKAAGGMRLTSEALENAIAQRTNGAAGGGDASITYAELVSPAGEPFIPIGLAVPATTHADTFFGVIEDASGKRIGSFERPAKPVLSKGVALYDMSFMLPKGSYTAIFGLANGGAPAVMAVAPIEVQAIDKAQPGTSRLLVSDIVETPDAAPEKSPFAFGKLKFVPRASFSPADTATYLLEIHNPGIETATNLPHMQAEVALVTPGGAAIKAPLTDVRPLPLSGVSGPGEYAIISGIPLGGIKPPLAPGEYTLRVRVLDLVTKATYSVEQKLKIAG